MTDDLAKKLKTAGAFDTPWLKEQLANWDVKAEQKKADFMEHMYQCSARANGLYTGLWQDFCLKEAGPYCRDEFYNRIEFIEKLKAGEFDNQEMQIPLTV
jgi:hypothetical protein